MVYQFRWTFPKGQKCGYPERSEPHTAKKIAEIKEIELELLGKITSENAKSLFKLDI